MKVTVIFLHRVVREVWYLTWLAEGIHLGRGPIDCALVGHTRGTINRAPTELLGKHKTPTPGMTETCLHRLCMLYSPRNP
jgi:hypothetical protein